MLLHSVAVRLSPSEIYIKDLDRDPVVPHSPASRLASGGLFQPGEYGHSKRTKAGKRVILPLKTVFH